MKALLAAATLLLLLPAARAQNQGRSRPGAPNQDPATARPPEQDVPPIQEEGEFYVLNFSEDDQDRLNLQEFVKICQEATGLNFTYNDQTAQQLQANPLVMFGPKRIAKDDFYLFFQIQMFINDFVCVEVGPSRISVILIQSLAAGRAGSQNIKQRSKHVLPEELDDYADQPATLITTVLNLPNIDVRQLSTSLRGLLTDTNTQTLLAAGDHSVILQGFGSYVASLARLLLIVDAESAEPEEALPIFEVLPLEYAAAEDVSDLLEDLLDQLRRSERGARGRGRRGQGGEGQGVSGPLAAGEVQTTILVDARTNSLLVMAMPEEMPRIKDLVARLDIDVIEPERNFHIYNLQNVQAEEIADVLDEFLRDAGRVGRQAQGGTGGQAASGGGGGGSRGRAGRDDVVVVPDNNTNSLLIAANKTRYEEVLELIRQLDTRQDQVLIESALIELNGTDFRDIGFEWALANVSDDPGGFGATSFGLSDLIDSDNDGVPDLRVPLLQDGLTAGILSGSDVNLPFLVAAAEESENANILNVPSVLVNNNGHARVVTLDEQPTTQVTATGVGGQTQENFSGYQEAGITLEISPSISASRYLRLDITLIVSNFTGLVRTTGTIPPPRITREMTTTVNVPDGDTMVIGGVISDISRETQQGVPWLMDIPLLGALFRRTTYSSVRTTLYFFATPHILHDRDFADLAEISYRKKLEAAEVIGADRIRVFDPDFGGATDAIDFEGFQVPLYRSPDRGEIDGESVGLDPMRQRELLEQQSVNQQSAEDTPPGSDG